MTWFKQHMHRQVDKSFLITICALCIVILLFPATLIAEETKSTGPQPSSEQKLSLIEIYTWSNSLPKDLIDLRNDIDSLADPSSFEKELPTITKLIEGLEWEATTLKSNPNLTFHEISSFESKLIRIGTRLTSLSTSINTNIKHLETWYKDWLVKEKKFQATVELADREFELEDALPDFNALAEILISGKLLIEEHLKPNLLAGHQIGKI